MLKPGGTVKHIKASNFINEVAEACNVAILQMATGARLAITMGRDTLEIDQETLVQNPDGISFSSQVLPEHVTLNRLVVANITMSLEAAKGLVQALNVAIGQAEEAERQHKAAQASR